jgi:DNA-binding transcriptional LysR family regulator
MGMDRWDELTAFIAVVEAGGFSSAARRTGVSQPSISKAVAALERRLGVVLLNRGTRSISPTEPGRIYYERAKPLLEEIQEVDAETTHRVRGVSGVLRISAPGTFGRLHVLPLIPEFLKAHPELEVDLILADAMRDMTEDRIDLAIRVGPVTEPDLVARKIAQTRLVYVGSQSYFAAHGRPRVPADLRQHNCLVYGAQRNANAWPFSGPGRAHRVKVAGSLRSNSIEAIRTGVLAGVGVGMMTEASLDAELDVPLIQTVLSEYADFSIDVNIAWPTKRFVPGKVRQATDYLEGAIARRLSHGSRRLHDQND